MTKVTIDDAFIPPKSAKNATPVRVPYVQWQTGSLMAQRVYQLLVDLNATKPVELIKCKFLPDNPNVSGIKFEIVVNYLVMDIALRREVTWTVRAETMQSMAAIEKGAREVLAQILQAFHVMSSDLASAGTNIGKLKEANS